MERFPGGSHQPSDLSPADCFRCRLAIALGLTLDEISAMKYSELQTWAAYDAKELLPDRRQELQLAEVAYLIAASNSRTPSRYTVSDFMPSVDQKQDPLAFLQELKHGG